MSNSDIPRQTGTSSGAEKANLACLKRREAKDILLDLNAPRSLTVCITLIAVVLCGLSILSCTATYQETAPIEIETTMDGSSPLINGTAYLRAPDLTQIRPGAVVLVDSTDSEIIKKKYESKITRILPTGRGSYEISIELSRDLVAILNREKHTEEPVQLHGVILTQKTRLVFKLFGTFRTMFGNREDGSSPSVVSQ